MNREEQIKELAGDIYSMIRSDTMSRALASLLYDKGWKKQSEWISVDERLPEESGDYLTYHNGVISALMYSAKHKLFNAADSLSKEYSKKHSITVSHWMSLPEAPKMKGGE